MESFVVEQVEEILSKWRGATVYIHLEVNPGAYWRNGQTTLVASHVKGNGPYRIFLQLDDGNGLIHVDDLTHMQIHADTMIATGYDEKDRLARTLEVSLHPFAMD